MSISEKKYAQISNYCRLITLNYTDTACLTMKNYPPTPPLYFAFVHRGSVIQMIDLTGG